MKTLSKKLKRAFTITELVIVIAVIAILAAVLIPTLSGVVEKARQSAAMQDCQSTWTTYYADEITTDTTCVNNVYYVVHYTTSGSTLKQDYYYTVTNGNFDTTAIEYGSDYATGAEAYVWEDTSTYAVYPTDTTNAEIIIYNATEAAEDAAEAATLSNVTAGSYYAKVVYTSGKDVKTTFWFSCTVASDSCTVTNVLSAEPTSKSSTEITTTASDSYKGYVTTLYSVSTN